MNDPSKLCLMIWLMLPLHTNCGLDDGTPNAVTPTSVTGSFKLNDCSNVSQSSFTSNIELPLSQHSLQNQATSDPSATEPLCQMLEQSNKSVVILQFAAILCESCKEEAVKVQDFIANHSRSSEIGHVLVFVDSQTGNWATRAAEWNGTHANNAATVRFEPSQKIYRSFNFGQPAKLGLMIAITENGGAYAVDGNSPDFIQQLDPQITQMLDL